MLLGVTALATMLTIDRTLNAIWRVRKPRPIAQRVLVYWAALTLGPLVIGISLSADLVCAVGVARHGRRRCRAGCRLLLDVLEFVLLALGMAGAVPLRAQHLGALAPCAGRRCLRRRRRSRLAKAGLAWYVAAVPSFSAVYGTFATLPILLLWIYLGWVIVLLGAVIAAYAPSLQHARRALAGDTGAPLRAGAGAAASVAPDRMPRRGAGLGGTWPLALLRADPLQVEPVLEQLMALDWVGRLDEDGGGAPRAAGRPGAHARPTRWSTRCCWRRARGSAAFRQRAGLVDRLTLAERLGRRGRGAQSPASRWLSAIR